jgi:hypothetical protein
VLVEASTTSERIWFPKLRLGWLSRLVFSSHQVTFGIVGLGTRMLRLMLLKTSGIKTSINGYCMVIAAVFGLGKWDGSREG